MTTLTETSMFDKKFVVAATIIGVAYAAIVAIIVAVFGTEIAAATGVALTALSTAIFTKFETLGFRPGNDNDGPEISLPSISVWK